MLPALMSRRTVLVSLLVVAAAVVSGCGLTFGTSGPELSKIDPQLRDGATIFNQRCGGCHTFEIAGTEGSAVKANSRERKDGPNFDQRKESYEAVLYAIRNGGFSSGPMPQNIATGRDAELVACFVAQYSGTKAQVVNQPSSGTSSTPETDCRTQLK
jgi:cytochrome c551